MPSTLWDILSFFRESQCSLEVVIIVQHYRRGVPVIDTLRNNSCSGWSESYFLSRLLRCTYQSRRKVGKSRRPDRARSLVGVHILLRRRMRTLNCSGDCCQKK